MGEGLYMRLEAEAVGRISDKKHKGSTQEKNYGVRYAKDGHNSYFSLSKFKSKRLIQICELLENSKNHSTETPKQYITNPRTIGRRNYSNKIRLLDIYR